MCTYYFEKCGSNPIQSNPNQSNPIQSNPIQSLYFFELALDFLIIFATPLLNVPTISPTSSFS